MESRVVHRVTSMNTVLRARFTCQLYERITDKVMEIIAYPEFGHTEDTSEN